MTGKKGSSHGINKRPHRRGRRVQLLKALMNYLTSDSYLYGPLLHPNNFRVLSNASPSGRPSSKGSFREMKRTSMAISSINIRNVSKPSSNYQSAQTIDPIHNVNGVSFRDDPVRCFEKIKHAIEQSTPTMEMEHIFELDTPATMVNGCGENEKRDHRDKIGKGSSKKRVSDLSGETKYVIEE